MDGRTNRKMDRQTDQSTDCVHATKDLMGKMVITNWAIALLTWIAGMKSVSMQWSQRLERYLSCSKAWDTLVM